MTDLHEILFDGDEFLKFLGPGPFIDINGHEVALKKAKIVKIQLDPTTGKDVRVIIEQVAE